MIRDDSQQACKRAEAQRIVGRDGDPLMIGFESLKDYVTPDLVNVPVSISSRHKVQADSRWHGPIEEECRNRFQHVFAQFLPSIPLRENILRQTFGAKPSVCLLNNLEYKLGHDSFIKCVPRYFKSGAPHQKRRAIACYYNCA